MWFVLPIIPTFLIFKLLPNTAIVKGPFKGLTIRLGGAFAAYFLLFVVLIPKMFTLIKDTEDSNRVWTISGSILDSAGHKIKITSNPRLTLIPTTEINNGEFKIKIVGKCDENGQVEFPIIAIQADNYVSTNLDPLDYMEGEELKSLSATQWEADYRSKTAKLRNDFRLKPDKIISPQPNNTVQDDTNSL